MSVETEDRTADSGTAAARRARYDSLVADLAWTATAPPGDTSLLAPAQAFVSWEARLCDEQRFDVWLRRWADDGIFWAPVRADRHPQKEQTLFVDDRRRLGERVGRWNDPSAWAHHPPARTTRVVGTVEAWARDDEEGDDVLIRSALTIWEHRRAVTRPWPVTQVHRLRRQSPDRLAGAMIVAKTLVVLGAADGVPNPAFLL